jgi:hypothetical protein
VLYWAAYLPVIRATGTHKAPRIDNSDPYNIALTVNGRVFQNIIVDTGCEMVVVGKTAARQAGIRPSMMRSGAVALWCADERVTKAFDQTIDPVSFVFNPGTENETTVMAQVVVTNTEADTMLLGMSVIGKIGLVPNPYKGTLKYYVDWETRGSRLAYLACVFDVQLGGKKKKSVRSTACEEVDSGAALAMPMMAMPKNSTSNIGRTVFNTRIVTENLLMNCPTIFLNLRCLLSRKWKRSHLSFHLSVTGT